jgi:hypothetical protein
MSGGLPEPDLGGLWNLDPDNVAAVLDALTAHLPR